MFVANFNVFMAALAGAAYLLGWLLEIPFSSIRLNYGGSFATALALMAIALIYVWTKWGLVGRAHGWKSRRFLLGQLGIALSNVILMGGIVLLFQAASVDHEEEYWAWLYVTYYIGPVAGSLFALSAALILSASASRHGAA